MESHMVMELYVHTKLLQQPIKCGHIIKSLTKTRSASYKQGTKHAIEVLKGIKLLISM